MKLKTFLYLFVIITLSACGPVVLPPTSSSPNTGLPDLIVSNVTLGMQGIPTNWTDCVPVYAPLETRVTLENRGTAPAINVFAVEQFTGYQMQIQNLPPGQSVEFSNPIGSNNGSYTIVVDPQNLVAESDETNNVYSYVSITPTPPALCSPTPPIFEVTMPPVTQSPISLTGLTYADMNLAQIWRISTNGTPVQVMNGINAQFSPDGLRALFEQSGDIWLAEPMDNPGRNLTNTPDKTEQFPQWWPSNPSKIIFNSIGVNEAQEQGWSHEIIGYVTMMNLDGSEYTTLSDTPSYTKPALSPDAQTIAYDMLGVPMLFINGVGSQEFEYSSYGYVPAVTNPVFMSPSISPDGRWLTWWVSEESSGAERHFSLVMFDLAEKSVRVFYAYTAPAGTLGWLDNPIWSPGGQWIAFQTRSEATPWDLWIMHSGGGMGQRFGLATNPVWSPDNQTVAFVQWPPRSDSNLSATLSIIFVPSRNIQQTNLPAGSIPLSWTTPGNP